VRIIYPFVKARKLSLYAALNPLRVDILKMAVLELSYI
jgi:hypothetical protein